MPFRPAAGPQGPYGQPQQPAYGQGPAGQPAYGQAGAAYGAQHGQDGPREGSGGQRPPGRDDRLPDGRGEPPNGSRIRLPRLIGALVIVLAAVATTAFTTTWIRNKADALTPVDLPSAAPTPLPTVCTKGYLEPKVENGLMINTVGDKMPLMPTPPWKEYGDPVTYRGMGQWLNVHVNYDGKKSSWGNLVAFGMFQPKEPFKATPAGLKYAAQLVGARMINRLYDGKLVPIKGTVTHRPITIDGHKAYEITARVPIKKAKLPETFSLLSILVVDRGNGTAAVSYGDFSGSTYQKWLPVWRQTVAKIKIAPTGGNGC